MFTLAIRRDDWSLHRKGAIDQARHMEKVKEAIKRNLADIVSEQSLITSDGKRVIRVPIRVLEEYRFRFDPDSGRQVGQGSGGTHVGDVVGRVGGGQRSGDGPQAGDQPGIDYYEAELTIEELSELIFEDLELPNLEEKRLRELESEAVRFTEIRRHGPFANLDKRRTLRENLRRNAWRGRARIGDFANEDLRFKTWERDVKRESNAVVIAMMDVSGSMGTFEKYVSRAFYYWMVRFLRTKYDRVEIRFIAHHAEAREVSEEEFFSRGESGGTRASTAYELALQLIRESYPPDSWNIYPFHFSDGDNWPSDNERCRELAEELLRCANLFGYGEIRQGRYTYQSTLMHTLQRIGSPKLVTVTITEKADVYQALRRFFGPEVGQEVARE